MNNADLYDEVRQSTEDDDDFYLDSRTAIAGTIEIVRPLIEKERDERLRAVADAAWRLSAVWTDTETGLDDVADAMSHLDTALNALDAGGENDD